VTINLPARPLGRARHLVKYATVSAVSTLTSLSVLAVLVGLGRVPAVLANVIAVAIGTVPSFELNRRWVWGQPGQRAPLAQVVPFCLLSFSGLAISSIAVHLAAEATSGGGRLWHTAAVEAANLGSYGALWLAQYFLCDKLLFRPQGPQADPGTPSAPHQQTIVDCLLEPSRKGA
jgi:putative flippase GtrA